MAVELVVFDMDDTLYLERDYVRSGFAAVGRDLLSSSGIEDFATVAWNLFLSGVRGNIFDIALLGLVGASGRDLVTRCVDIYRSHVPDISLLDDAIQLLGLVPSTVGTALITDGPRASQSAKAHALGLYDNLGSVILTGDLGPGAAKPSVRAFRKIEEEFGINGSACLYIGDNPMKDFIAPLSLGWATWRVRRPLSLHEHVETMDDQTVTTTSLAEVPSFLRGAWQ